MGKENKQTNDQEIFQNILNITHYWGNANQKY